MCPISSIYIPHIKKDTKAEFIAYIFERNLIAQVSRVAIECNKKTKKYSAFVGIHAWYDTETAYNFMTRLKNPNKEARFVYKDDKWWTVEINRYPHKLASNKNRALTIFSGARIPSDYSRIDYPIPFPPDFLPDFDDQDQDQDAVDFEQYLRDIDEERQIIVYEMNGLF